ncbi:SMI1/KNR4 family protein [Paenibacillus sp. PCH8]|uniref:SMI1/KNR4 family protein n=1 Tax=Paenibacillus sp. PCH8 TaxID=2066524 RepID=UPI0021571B2A|nr:SMI1/KNR4 family protein [Paenibacillus sp. PCH8]
MRKHQIPIDKPLSSLEIESIERRYKIVFPPDLKDLYLCGLPVGEGYPNWRDTSEENIKLIISKLEWPLHGMLFDIEHNSYWYDGWGIRPSKLEAAFQVCKEKFKEVPILIPIYSHRFIPSKPNEINNPIFSIYQTDIIYYGENLEEYFKVELRSKRHNEIKFNDIKEIEFWSELL